MKFSLAVLVFTIALFAQQSEQQFFGGLGFRAGLGIRRFGLGFGGLGLGLGGIPVPVPVAVPVPVGAGLGGVGFGGAVGGVAPFAAPGAGFGVLGKRDVTNYGYNKMEGSKAVESESKVEGHENNGHLFNSEDKFLTPEQSAEHQHKTVAPDFEHRFQQVEGLEQRVENGTDGFGFFENVTAHGEQAFGFFENVTARRQESGFVKRQIVFPVRPIVPIVPLVRTIVPVATVIRPIVPIVRAVPVLVGRRSVNETESVEGKLFVENGTVCTLSTHRGIFSCAGLNFNFECGVVSNLTVLGSFEHRGENFRMLPEGLVSFNSSESLEVNRVEIVSFRDESVEFNDYTFVHGGQKVLLSLYWSESVRDLGFRFVEQQCWRSYVDMLRSLSPRNVRLVLDIARV